MNAHRFEQVARTAVVICLLPSAAMAQRGMGGGGGGGKGGRGGIGNLDRAAAIEIPKYVNPVNLLVQHRQDLALSDSQFVRVIRVKRMSDSTNAPYVRRLDSVQVLFKGNGPLFGDASPGRRDSLSAARAVVQETIGILRQNVDDAREQAYALLSSMQLFKAQGYEQQATKIIEDEKSAASEGRRGGTRPPTS